MTETTLVLDRAALRKITQYAHWMPALRGISGEYITRNYPGWEWNEILPVLIKKGIMKRYSSDPNQHKLFQDLSIADDVRSIVLEKTGAEVSVTIRRSKTIASD